MRVALLMLALTVAPAAAQTTTTENPTLQAVYACAAEGDDARRLACYDEAAGRLRAAVQSGEVVTVDRVQMENLERESFGFALPSLPRLFGVNVDAAPRPTLEENEMELARVVQGGNGRAVFTMTNGQVWAQLGTDNARRARAGGKVTIRRAALGSFLMSVEAGGPAIRVRRQE
jgi:hypothetical protein